MIKLPPNTARLLLRNPLLRPQPSTRRLLSDKPPPRYPNIKPRPSSSNTNGKYSSPATYTPTPRSTLASKLPGVTTSTPLQDFTAPRPQLERPLGNVPEGSREGITLRIVGERLRSRVWWRGYFLMWKHYFWHFVFIIFGMYTSMWCLHLAGLRLHDMDDPTPKSWRYWARYCFLRARAMHLLPPIWGLGGDVSEDDVEMWYDKALETVMEDTQIKGGYAGSGVDEEWKLGVLKLRLVRAKFFREVKEDFKRESKELYEALGVPVKDGVAVRERVEAAVRLARVLEWEGQLKLAMDVLRGAVGIAFPGIRDKERGGVVPLPPMLNSKLPVMGSIDNTPELMDALSELGMFFARHEEELVGLELLTEVLMRRKKGPSVSDPMEPSAAEKISDPCKVASSMAGVGELMFAIGKKMDGLAWEEKAFMESRPLAEFRKACKECAGVSASNLIQMGNLLIEEHDNAEEKAKGWFWQKEKDSENSFTKKDAEMLVAIYKSELNDIMAIRAVKDDPEPTKKGRFD